MTVKRSWELLPQNRKKEISEEIIEYFKNERDEQMGLIAAEAILDLILQSAGLYIYNKGIEDASSLLKGRLEDIEIDLDSLRRY